MIKALGRRSARMLLTATALLAGAAGIALATIPGSNGVINGCFEKRTGLLRVIDTEAGKTCTQWETPISWNQKGEQGLQGIQGEKGDKGDPGVPGEDGAAGAPGADGKDGQDGVSVTSEAVAAGDENCANGGSKFTAANGVTYACNGAQGPLGAGGGDTGKPWTSVGSHTTKTNLETLLAQYPLTRYEWGIQFLGAYNSVWRISFSHWNVGIRIMTEPALQGDASGGLTPDSVWLGGSAWFYGTAGSFDDECTNADQFKHQYWRWVNGRVEWNTGSSGCGGGTFYVRER
jgi:hypothetical protein